MLVQDLIGSIEAYNWERDDERSSDTMHVYKRSDKPDPIVIRGHLTHIIPAAEAQGIISYAC